MATDDLSSRLVALLREGSVIQLAYVAGLSSAEREAPGTPQRWSAKDLVAHLTGWKARRLLQLEAVLRGEAAPEFDMDETNARAWEEQQRRSWDDVLAEEAGVAPEMAACIERMMPAELTMMDRYALPIQPAALQLVRPGYTHIIGHLAQHHISRGEMERAVALREAAAASLDAFPEFPEMASAPHYNLACSYALTDQRERALSELRRALVLSPALVAYARDDLDLVALREMVEFGALVEGA
jgi:tetratricopeptide (TPR) repeat protein